MLSSPQPSMPEDVARGGEADAVASEQPDLERGSADEGGLAVEDRRRGGGVDLDEAGVIARELCGSLHIGHELGADAHVVSVTVDKPNVLHVIFHSAVAKDGSS